MPFRGRNSLTGFTLLELVIVLFIIGLASAVVFFSAVRIHEKTLFNEEARKLFLTIKHAREISLIERRDVVFNLDAEQNNYWIAYGEDDVVNIHSLPRGFGITGDLIYFFPKGNSSGGTVKIDNGKGKEYTIEVDRVLGTPTIKRL
jgi:general secretion pathway protein H